MHAATQYAHQEKAIENTENVNINSNTFSVRNNDVSIIFRFLS